jgi:competence protein ComEC
VLQVDLLKVPHHGSRFQDEEFLAATSARVAVVSAGEDNPYGHPAPELLDALAGSGMLVARTDTEGTVAVVAGDDGLRVQVLP